MCDWSFREKKKKKKTPEDDLPDKLAKTGFKSKYHAGMLEVKRPVTDSLYEEKRNLPFQSQ